MRNVALFSFVGVVMVGRVLCQSTPSSVLQTLGSRSRVRVGFGESCNKTIRCKSGAWLSCDQDEGRCQCVKPDEMIYDLRRQKCVGLIGERCKFGIAGAVDESETEGGGPGSSNKLFEMSECVEGAVCSEVKGVCQCPPSSYEDIDANKCSQSKGHGLPCASQVECDSNQMLACLGGTCQCFSPKEMNFDQTARICTIRVGMNCKSLVEQYQSTTPLIPVLHGRQGEHNLEIAETAEWLRIISSFSRTKCHNGSSCSDSAGVCTCPLGQYIDYQNGSCAPVKKLSSGCKKSEECDSTLMLTCVGGKCVCDPDIAFLNIKTFSITKSNPYSHYGSDSFNVPTGICLKKVGKFCSVEYATSGDYDYDPYSRRQYTNPHPNNTYCIEDADCQGNLCQCKGGYEPTKDKMCGREYNQECAIQSPCSDRFLCTSTESDASRMKCLCPNTESQIFDPQKYVTEGVTRAGSCRGLIGTPCNQPDSRPCVQNAECISQDHDESQFICKCKAGFVENSRQKCDFEHGTSCANIRTISDDGRCDSRAGLYCKIVRSHKQEESEQLVKICQCRDFSDVYEADKRKCLKPVGYACKNSSTCVSHAVCTLEIGSEWGRCICEEGYAPTISQLSNNAAICIPLASQLNLNSNDHPATQNQVNLDTLEDNPGTSTTAGFLINPTMITTSSEERSLENDVDNS